MTFAGYWFGGIPIVKQNFELVVIAIVLLSVLPAAWEFAMLRWWRKEEASLGDGKAPQAIGRE
jgi:membrane-associated protein